MIDGIETALESPSLLLSRAPTSLATNHSRSPSLQEGHNGPSSADFPRNPSRDGHLTPHPSPVLFDCSMARATILSPAIIPAELVSGSSTCSSNGSPAIHSVSEAEFAPPGDPQRLSNIFIATRGFKEPDRSLEILSPSRGVFEFL